MTCEPANCNVPARHKYLCVCQYGHSRSVALARVLHAQRQEAVPVGWLTSLSALAPLSVWADRICVLQASFANYIEHPHRGKIIVFDVGPDVWSNPYNLELQHILTCMVKEKLGLG